VKPALDQHANSPGHGACCYTVFTVFCPMVVVRFGHYQIIQHGKRRVLCRQLAESDSVKVEWPRVEPTTSGLRFGHHNHYSIMLQFCVKRVKRSFPLSVQCEYHTQYVRWPSSLFWQMWIIRMWWSLNANSMMFELRTFSTDSKFDECFNRFVVECKFVGKSLSFDRFHMHREPESTDKLVFI